MNMTIEDLLIALLAAGWQVDVRRLQAGRYRYDEFVVNCENQDRDPLTRLHAAARGCELRETLERVYVAIEGHRRRQEFQTKGKHDGTT